MRWALIILSLIFCSYGYSQSTTLTILGKTSYTVHPITYIYKISNTRHDYSAADVDRLKFILDSAGVIFRMDSTNGTWMDPETGSSIDFYTHTLHDFELLKQQSTQMGMYGVENFIYANEDFTYQDTLASMAYHDALKRAKIIAQYLGKKITGVRNIDDHVERYLFYLDILPSLRCKIEQANEWISLIEMIFSNPDAQQQERTGQYALWVTFEVK